MVFVDIKATANLFLVVEMDISEERLLVNVRRGRDGERWGERIKEREGASASACTRDKKEERERRSEEK